LATPSATNAPTYETEKPVKLSKSSGSAAAPKAAERPSARIRAS